MKQAILIRKDLNADKGKIAVQVAHASVSSALLVQKKKPKLFEKWKTYGQKKVVLKVENEKELREFKKKATSARIPNVLISDAGLTQLAPGTTTALGIGPAEDDKIDQLVGSLKLM